MFERYSEGARRTLFFARSEALQTGGRTIEPEHLLLGALRESDAVLRFSRARDTASTIRARLEPATVAGERVSTSVEIPFSPSCKEVLEQAAFEADALKNMTIRPEHMILAIIVRANGVAAPALQDAGVEPNAIRNYLRGVPDDSPERR
jgi:ATP-dependent Clp protease ATP-binding subunit ClpA